MPLKIVSVPVEKNVTMLEDAEVSFISLVRHGANRMPFRVMKADVEKGGPGSGHFGHAGIPGHRGGSAPGDGEGGADADVDTTSESAVEMSLISDFVHNEDLSVALQDGVDGEEDVENLLIDYFDTAPGIRSAISFKNSGVLTDDRGLTINAEDGNSYQLTIQLAETEVLSMPGVRSFSSAGLLTNNAGVVMDFRNKENPRTVDIYQVTIVQSERGRKREKMNTSKACGDKKKKKKNEKIHCVIVPETITLEQLAQQVGNGWMNDISMDNVTKNEGYSKYIQTPLEDFVPESMSIAKIDDAGVFAITGELKKKSDDLQSIALPFVYDSVSFNDGVYNELAMMYINVIPALFNAEKQEVSNAINSFRNFLFAAADAIGDGTFVAKSIGKAEESELLKNAFGIEKEEYNEGGIQEMWKSKEEFVADVIQIVESVLAKKAAETEEEKKKRLEAEAAAAEEAKKKSEEDAKRVADLTAAVDTKIAEGMKKVDEAVAKMEKIGQDLESQLQTSPQPIEDTGVARKTEKNKSKSPFAGMLTKTKEAVQ